MIGDCPHCGKNDHVYTNNRVYGWIERSYDLEGRYAETSIDNMLSAASKTIRCASCQKERRDLVFRNGVICKKHLS